MKPIRFTLVLLFALTYGACLDADPDVTVEEQQGLCTGPDCEGQSDADDEADLITPGCDNPSGDDDRICEGGPGSGGPTIPGSQGPTPPVITPRDLCELTRQIACCVTYPQLTWCPRM